VPSSASIRRAASERRPATALPRWRRVLIWLRRGVEALILMAALGTLFLWCSVPDVGKLATENPTTTAFIDLRRDQARAAGQPFELEWTWKPRRMISRYLRLAVIYAEDVHFYTHEGVDWDAIEQAAAHAWDKGTFSRGGSTITQQLAKNLYLSPDRSLIRKARELWIAYALEAHLDKERILEIYLNVVEWGPGVFGAEAAARHWYHRSAAALTPAQAARLAVALPNPRLYAPNVASADLDKKAARILRLMRRDKLIDAAQRQQGMTELGLTVPDPVPPAPPDKPAPAPATTPTPAPSTTPTPPAPETPVETEETEPPAP
jgi:monofunctional biosynthetic peptidoglycan transglycosylase